MFFIRLELVGGNVGSIVWIVTTAHLNRLQPEPQIDVMIVTCRSEMLTF